VIPYFNTSGPCVAGEHYMLPPERRLTRVMELVEQRRYFTLHSGRQTGKTTCARWLVSHYNREGRFAALWVDIQTAREQPSLAVVVREILAEIGRSVRRDLPGLPVLDIPEQERLLRVPESALLESLSNLCAASRAPVAVFIDEADGLVGPAMVSFLTQLRRGYIDRSATPFPASVALVGQRQVRDYVLGAEERRAVAWLGTTSPFNITAEAQTLAPFTEAEVSDLLAQHTAATGQRFEPAAAARVHELSAGHPWLVNALADQCVRDVRDRTVPITAEHVAAAKETIILERRTHIDSLVVRLREPRVQQIIAPMLAGEQTAGDVLDDDFSYVVSLGLIDWQRGQWQIANPIYRELIPRALTHVRQGQIAVDPAWYLRADGGLDMAALLAGFQQFWRKDGHLAAEGFQYREAGPHLMLMAFLQRVVNSGGRIEREYGLGRGRLDLYVAWRDERHLLEVKLRRDTETEEEALEQLARYLDGAGLAEGWLVLFDLRKTVPWAEKLTTRTVELAGKRLHIVGC
jgi:type II secretory pathway predicted ATPase ExeA